MTPEVLVADLRSTKEYFDRSTRCLTEEDSTFAPAEGTWTVAQQVAHRILHGLGQALAAQQRAPPPRGPPVPMEDLRKELETAAYALEQFSKQARQMFSDEGQLALRGRRPMLVKVCKELRQGGFKYAEIAVLIGDRTRGACDRIRMRCATGERSKRRM